MTAVEAGVGLADLAMEKTGDMPARGLETTTRVVTAAAKVVVARVAGLVAAVSETVDTTKLAVGIIEAIVVTSEAAEVAEIGLVRPISPWQLDPATETSVTPLRTPAFEKSGLSAPGCMR
jgi:hypothetical protein